MTARPVARERAAGLALMRVMVLVVTLALAGCAVAPDAAVPAAAGAARLDATAALVSTCSGCHQPGGRAIVDLHGFPAARIEQALQDYRQAVDGPTAMHRMARGWTDAEIAAIAVRLGQ